MRLRQHQKSGLALAQRLVRHPAVARVLHPALPGDAGHALWQRDFHGASGLFGVALQPLSREQLSVFFASLRLFGIGLSWGGYESLALPVDPPARSVRSLACEGTPSLRRVTVIVRGMNASSTPGSSVGVWACAERTDGMSAKAASDPMR